MKNKALLITVLVFIVVLAVAGALYSRLGENISAGGLVTAATESPTTEAATRNTEAVTQSTEITEPRAVPAWDFTVVDAEGNEAKLSDYFGKPIVLNFWAYWCGPCQSEMPLFNAMYEELGGEVVFLMTHVGSGMEDGKELVEQNGYTFPVLYDTERIAAAGYGVNAFPTSFFIDKDGNVRAYYVGIMREELLQKGVDLIYTTAD